MIPYNNPQSITREQLLENDLVLQTAIETLRTYVDNTKYNELSVKNSNSIDDIGYDINVINQTISDLSRIVQDNKEKAIKNVLDILDIQTVNTRQDINIANNTNKVNTLDAKIDAIETYQVALRNDVDENTSGVFKNKASIDTINTNQSQLRIDVDALMALVESDNINLDTIQEIVDYIEANRDALNNLTIDSIFGLRAKLDAMQIDIDSFKAKLTVDDQSLDSLQEIVNYIKADHTYLYNFNASNIVGLDSRLNSMDNKIGLIDAKVDTYGSLIEGNANAISILQGQSELARADYLYETTYVKGYTSMGYKSSTAYTTCHVTNHSNDVTNIVNNVYSSPGSYICGSYNDLNQFIYGSGPKHSGVNYSETQKLDYVTVTGSIGTPLPAAGNNGGTMFNRKTFAWIVAIFPTSYSSWNKKLRHTYVTDTYTNEEFVDTNDGLSSQQVVYFNSSTAGYIVSNSTITAGKSSGKKRNFSTLFSTGITFFIDYPSTAFYSGSANAMNTYFDVVYVSAGNGGKNATMYKVDIPTMTHVLTTNKVSSIGFMQEENFQTGNEAGYTIGAYFDGVQSPRAFKLNFRTETGVELGTASRAKTLGTSSGYASAATI